jgi:signal transduction histidine kinase
MWVVGALLLPLAAVLGLAHEANAADSAAAARTILVASATLAAAMLLHLHGRLAGNDQSTWVSVALAVGALAGLARGGHALTHPEDARRQAAAVLVISISVAVITVVMVLLAARTRRGFRLPLVAAPLCLAVLVAQQLLVTRGPALEGRLLLPLLTVLLGLVSLALAVTFLRLSTLPLWARCRLGAAVVLTALSVAVGAPAIDQPLVSGFALACGLVGGIVLASTGAALLRLVIGEEERALADMHSRLSGMETEQRADQARWHEVNTIVAGVASASRLIADTEASDHREGLQAMVLDELGRLQRMLSERRAFPPTTPPDGDVDLDEVVRQIVTAHRARGREVAWAPSGLHVRSRSDDIAEVLNILVDNAAVHGSPDGISVAVDRAGAAVEIAICDQGPGVVPELHEHLFDWGVHRSGSPGHGIGLYAASELTRGLGGALRLDAAGPGARFVLRIPNAPEGVGAHAALAQLTP